MTKYDDLINRLKKETYWLGGSELYSHDVHPIICDEVANAIIELLDRLEKAENIASDLCDDFTDFVTGGVHNAAPYCANKRPECVNSHGWCNGDNRVCKGFLPKAAVKGENSIACALGSNGAAKGALGCWLCLAEYDSDGNVTGGQFVQVDGERIEADTYYTLKNGEFVEVEEG